MADKLNMQNNDAVLALDSQLCFALYSAQLAMGKVYRNFLDQLSLTYPQYLVMLLLWEHDGVCVNDLGARLFLDSATLTPLLKRLQSMGLLEKHRSLKDQRQVILNLSDAGKALKEKAYAIPNGVLCSTGCNPAQAKQLKTDLENLRKSLLNSIRSK